MPGMGSGLNPGVAAGRLLLERLKALEERLLELVNAVLGRIGAEPLDAVILSLRRLYEAESLDEDEDIPRGRIVKGRYRHGEKRIVLYRDADLETLLHELVHHLQYTGHRGVVEVDARLALDSLERLPYRARLSEIEAYASTDRLRRILPRETLEHIQDILSEFHGLARLVDAVALIDAHIEEYWGSSSIGERALGDLLRGARVKSYRLYAVDGRLGVEVLVEAEEFMGYANVVFEADNPALDIVARVAGEADGVLVSQEDIQTGVHPLPVTPLAVLYKARPGAHPLIESVDDGLLGRSAISALHAIVERSVSEKMSDLMLPGEPRECAREASRRFEEIMAHVESSLRELMGKARIVKGGDILLLPTPLYISVSVAKTMPRRSPVYLMVDNKVFSSLVSNSLRDAVKNAIIAWCTRHLPPDRQLSLLGDELELELGL